MPDLDYPAMLQMALEEARQGRAEGGIPIGAVLFHRQGQLLGRGHNRRVQQRSVGTCGDGRLPQGRTATPVPRHDHGNDAGAMLVL